MERQLEHTKKQPEVADDIDELGRVQEDIDNVHRASLVVGQFGTVSEYVAKSSRAVRTNQDIGKVVIAELGYGAIGISNVDDISDVKQKIGDVSVSKKGTVFVGIHNNIDHNAALASHWSPASKP